LLAVGWLLLWGGFEFGNAFLQEFAVMRESNIGNVPVLLRAQEFAGARISRSLMAS
jgi:hypothetical protein